MQQISADVFPFANGAKNARYCRATALRVVVCLPAGCFRSRFRFLADSGHATASNSAGGLSPPGYPSGQMGLAG